MLSDPRYILSTGCAARIADELDVVGRSASLWLIEGGRSTGISDQLINACREYQGRHPGTLVAYVRRRDLLDADVPSLAPFGVIAQAATRLWSEIATARNLSRTPADELTWIQTISVFERATNIVELIDGLRHSLSSDSVFPVICIVDCAFLFDSARPLAAEPLLRLIRAMHPADGHREIDARLLLGLCPYQKDVAGIHELLNKLGSPRPDLHFGVVSAHASPALCEAQQIGLAIKSLTSYSRDELRRLVPGRRSPFRGHHHELVVHGLLTVETDERDQIASVNLPELVAFEASATDERRMERPLWHGKLFQETIGCYVDLDNILEEGSLWIDGLMSALSLINKDDDISKLVTKSQVKCWLVLVANTQTARSTPFRELLKLIVEQTDSRGLFKSDDLDRIELRIVSRAREAADTAFVQLMRGDGVTSHKIAVTGDEKLAASILFARSSCLGQLVLVTRATVQSTLRKECTRSGVECIIVPPTTT